MNLSDLRQDIDSIDSNILQLIVKRLDKAKEIALYKKEHHIAQLQPAREQQLLAEKRLLANKFNLDPNFITEIYQILIKESHKVQSPILNSLPTKQSNFFNFKLNYRGFKLDINLSIFDVFTRVYANFDTFFFLESLGDDKDFSRYSYLGFGPKYLIQARKKQLFINKQEIDCQGNPWQFLQNNFPTDLLPSSSSFQGGLVGYGTYETYRYQEDKPDFFADNDDFYDFEFGLYLEGLKYNLQNKTIEYFTLDQDNSAQIYQILNSPVELAEGKINAQGSNFSDEEFITMINKLKLEIDQGNVFQIVPSRKFYFDISGSTLDIYCRLREQNPSPHMFFLKFADRQIIGSSPELVARVEQKVVESYPIAGTRSRGKTTAEDAKLANELCNDEKEVAEHLMLVDMARDDLGRVCEYGSVKVDKLMLVKKFSHVQHLVSHISGKLAQDKNVFEAVMTSLPMGTVSGAPRLEAVKLLHTHEKLPRGPYAGFVGYFSFSGDAIAALAIRSIFVSKNQAYIQAGAGVVYDSVAEYEKAEVDKKAQAMFKALLS